MGNMQQFVEMGFDPCRAVRGTDLWRIRRWMSNSVKWKIDDGIDKDKGLGFKATMKVENKLYMSRENFHKAEFS